MTIGHSNAGRQHLRLVYSASYTDKAYARARFTSIIFPRRSLFQRLNPGELIHSVDVVVVVFLCWKVSLSANFCNRLTEHGDSFKLWKFYWRFSQRPRKNDRHSTKSFGESRAQKHLSSKLNILHSLNPKFNMHNFPPVMFLHTKHVSSHRHFLSLGKLTSSTSVHFE